jgi:hypothetical protein
MPGINDRVFGSDIDVRVKKKLEARQLLAEKDRNPLEQIKPSQYPDDRAAYYTHDELNDLNFDGVADLSSRTPFVRMWTAVEIRTHTNEGEPKDEIPASKDPSLIYVKEDGKIQPKKVSNYERIVYQLGNHINNEFSDILNQRQGNALGGVNSTDVIPNVFETNNNEFMKPAAGITSITSNTEGMLGAIKKTSVNFVVHNFHDYDKIYSKYFLRPGAQIFVDFGWDSIKQLYKPEDLIDTTKIVKLGRGNTIEEVLFGEGGYVTDSYGDLETLIGFVTSFDSKVKENGSVECTLEIVSKNAALINGELENSVKNRIQYLLDAEIMSYASRYFKGFEEKSFLDRDWANSAEDINDWNKVSYLFASSQLSSKLSNFPTSNSTTTGVYWQTFIDESGNALPGGTSNIYVSFGFLEDKILNGEFGVGKDLVNILGENINKEAGNFEVRYDSSNSFITWNKNLKLRQKFEKDARKISYLYPFEWDETYNTNRGKTPEREEEFVKGDVVESNLSSQENQVIATGDTKQKPKFTIDNSAIISPKSITQSDIEKNRIPLRELFISLKVIKNSFKKATTIEDAINDILNEINKDSYEAIDLQISSATQDNTKLSIVDRNLLDYRDESEDDFDKLFVFKPMSKNSIVKSYDLSLTTPKGEFQSMIAIQTMSTEKSLFPLSSIVDKYLGVSMLNQNDKRRDSKSNDQGVVYLPEIGSYQTDKIDEDNALDTSIAFNFDEEKFISKEDSDQNVKLDSMSLNFVEGFAEDFNSAIESAKESGDVVDDGKFDNTSDIDDQTFDETTTDQLTASSIAEFYGMRAKSNMIDTVPTILSVANLSLTIYGISSLVPGDIFKVDYLPERQRKLLYFQVTKVTNNVNSSTWSTTLETVPRIRQNKKLQSGLFRKPKEVVLSTSALDKLADKEQVVLFKSYIKKLKYINSENFSEIGLEGVGYYFEFVGRRDTTTQIFNNRSKFQLNIKDDIIGGLSKVKNLAISNFDSSAPPDFNFNVNVYPTDTVTILKNTMVYSLKSEYYINIKEGVKYEIFVLGDIFLVYPKDLPQENIKKIKNYIFYNQLSF